MDEMMARLKQGGQSSSSGSSGGSGRKRRRRSEQPVVQARRKRVRLVIIIASLILAVLLGWIGLSWLNRMRIETDAFRSSANRRLSTLAGFQVDLGRLRAGGGGSLATADARFFANRVSLFERAEGFHLAAQLTPSSWYSTEWGIVDLSFRELTLKLNPQNLGQGAAWSILAIPDKDSSLTASPAESKFRINLAPEPDRVSVDTVRVVNFGVQWPALGNTVEKISQLDGSVKISSAHEMRGSFAEGTLALARFPEFAVPKLNFVLRNNTDLELEGARIEIGKVGSAVVSGKALLTTTGQTDFKVALTDILLADIVTEAWKSIFAGTIKTGSAQWTSGFKPQAERELKGNVSIMGPIVRDVPFVKKLAYALKVPELEILQFDELKADFSWTPRRTTLTKIMATREGWYRLEGDVAVNADDTVTGILRFSVTDRVFGAALRLNPGPFTLVEGGMAAAEFKIEGPISQLADSLAVVRDASPLERAPTATPLPRGPNLPRNTAPSAPTPPAGSPDAAELFKQMTK
jgi:hypothetical protein